MRTAVLGYYALSSGNFLPTFGDKLSIPSPSVTNTKRKHVANSTGFTLGGVWVVLGSFALVNTEILNFPVQFQFCLFIFFILLKDLLFSFSSLIPHCVSLVSGPAHCIFTIK
jgi:hypothetical protein